LIFALASPYLLVEGHRDRGLVDPTYYTLAKCRREPRSKKEQSSNEAIKRLGATKSTQQSRVDVGVEVEAER
jgi:hypothetical protein